MNSVKEENEMEHIPNLFVKGWMEILIFSSVKGLIKKYERISKKRLRPHYTRECPFTKDDFITFSPDMNHASRSFLRHYLGTEAPNGLSINYTFGDTSG